MSGMSRFSYGLSRRLSVDGDMEMIVGVGPKVYMLVECGIARR
jgi:hypothetical protein